MSKPVDSLFLAVYDIGQDRNRARMARRLEDLGLRIQFSAFECILTPTELADLVDFAMKNMDPEKDSFRVYPLCAGCASRVVRLGRRSPYEESPYVFAL